MQGDLLCLPAPFTTVARPSEIDQDLPHYLSRDGEKVRPITPVLLSGLNQTQVSFVHQCGCLQDVILPFEVHVVMSDPMQLRMDHRDQFIQG